MGNKKIKKNIKTNYLYTLAYQLLTLFTPFITTPYISRTLNADGIGIYSYCFSIVSYFTIIAAMGTAAYGQRQISYLQDNKDEYSIVFWENEIVSIASTLVSLILYIVYFIWGAKDYKDILAIMGMNILAIAFDITWFFQGLEEFQLIVKRNTLIKLVSIILLFVLVKGRNDLGVYCLIMSGSSLFSSFPMWISIPKYLKIIPINTIHPLKEVKQVMLLFLPTLASSVYTVLDKTMIGILTHNNFENGYYEQAIKMSKLSLSFITAFVTVLIPRIGFFFSKGDKLNMEKYMYKGYRFALFLGLPISLGLILISDFFVPWFFGEGYEKVITLLHVLPLLVIFIGLSTVTGSGYLIPTKRQNVFTCTVILGAIVNCFLNYILIPKMMSHGAAIASVIAEFIVAFFQLFYIRKEISIVRIIHECKWYFVSSILMALVIMLIKKCMSRSFLSTISLVGAGIMIYLLVLFVAKDNLFFEIKNSIELKLLKRKKF